MEEFIKTDTFRRTAADTAREVARTKQQVGIGTTRGRPAYVVIPVPERRRAQFRCVELGPDELRRNFTEIRCLVRLEDIPFGVIVDEKLTAIFRRHPRSTPAAADNYRAMYRRKDTETTESRLAAMENRIAEVEQTLRRLMAPTPKSKP
jgi:hypothetical protein